VKRGETHSVLFYLAIMIITIVVLSGVFLVIHQTSKRLTDDAPCATQILGHSVAVRITNELAAPTISCPTRRIVKEVHSEEEGKKIVADQMVKCWDQWGKGKLALFGEKPANYCHICSTVELTGVPELTKFGAYLETERATQSQTYSQYLRGVKSGTFFEEAAIPKLTNGGTFAPISTDKPIGVVFYYAKGQDKIDQLRNKLVQPAVGGSVGLAAGAGVALIAIGVVTSATGVGIPVGVALATTGASAAFGGVAGVVGGNTARAPLSFMTVVTVRSLSSEDIATLDCEYDPVSN
jgi:hypothetical protein